MAPDDDDPAQAGVRAAESVVHLARAEIRLAISEAKVAGERLLVTLALSLAAFFLTALAVALIVVSPLLWVSHPGATTASLLIALALAGSVSASAVRRWQKPRTPRDGETHPPAHDLGDRDHAIPR